MNLEEILLVDDVVKSVNDNLDIILDYIPEIRFMLKFDQKNPNHHLDVWNHTLYALSLSDNDFDVRVALLFHDIGKPFSYQDVEHSNGLVRHFKNHPSVSSKLTNIILNRLNMYDEEWIEYICELIRCHDSPITEKMIKELTYTEKLYKIQYCDAMAHNPLKLERRIEYLEKTKKLLKIN